MQHNIDNLEKRMDSLEKKLDLLMSNHLHHMSKDLKSLNAVFRRGFVLLTVGFIVVIGVLLVG